MRGFIPFLLVLFLLAVFFQIPFFLKIVYLFAVLYLLALFWLGRIERNLKLERHFVNRAFPGDTVPVHLSLTNTGRLPIPGLELSEATPTLLVSPPFAPRGLSLDPGEMQTFTYELKCRRRGYFQVGPAQAEVGDLLGLVRPRTITLPTAPVTVYPKVLPLAQLGLPARSPLAALPSALPLFEDPHRVVGVRAYHPGDSPRRIHWSASASANHLMVKEFSPSLARETLICLNLDEEDYALRQRYHATELAVTVAASIAGHIITRESLPAGLMCRARDAAREVVSDWLYLPRSEQAQLMLILEMLARVQPVTNSSFLDLLQKAGTMLSWGATIVVITGQKTVPLLETLLYLRRMGFAVALVLVQEEAIGSGPPIPKGIRAHRVWREMDLETWA